MLLDEIIQFLKRFPPFQFLDEIQLKNITRNLSMEFYPQGTVILKQFGPPSDTVKVIKKGAVEVRMRSDSGEDVVMDYKGEGDNFGFLSLIGKDRQRTTVVAIEDTICYVLNKETVLKLIETSPVFNEYFLSYLSKYVDKTYQEMHDKSLFYGSSDRYLFATSVGDVAHEAITIDEETSIQEAAQVMVENRISSLLVTDQNHLPKGIITDRDLREKVVAKARPVSGPVKPIVSPSLIRVEASESCFEALLKMIKYNVHHMLVIQEGRLKGIMTNHDLMTLQGISPLSLAKDIINQQSIEGLIPVSLQINNIVGLLLKEDAKAGSITNIISEINDRLVRKVLEIVEQELGPAPLPYCWIVFGSEGRREQTFKTDQDNALIFNDPATAEEEEKARSYFAQFSVLANQGLQQVGFPMCPAQYMASNPLWCQPLKVWKRYFSTWVDQPVPDSLLRFLIFFDFRPLHGKQLLAEDLKNFITSLLVNQKVFLGHMANMMLQITPPIGFFNTFVVEKSGEHKDKFDLKVKGITPLLNVVRLFSMEKGIKETVTLDRIQALKSKDDLVERVADELEHAYDFLMLLRIHHQFEQIKAGQTPDNFINPNQLSSLEKKTLKESFHLMSKMQGLVVEKYKQLIR
jgi:CBS domain-containing protein